MTKKNVTIALDSSEYKLLENIKANTKTKSLTQTVVKLIDFYKLNSEKIKHLNSEEKSVMERILTLEKQIEINLDNTINRSEFTYLKENVDLIKNNMDLTKRLLERTEFLQDNFIEKENLNLVLDRLKNLDQLVSLLVQQNMASDTNDPSIAKSSEINSLLRAKEKLRKTK